MEDNNLRDNDYSSFSLAKKPSKAAPQEETPKPLIVKSQKEIEKLEKLEKINKESLDQYSYRGRRNNFMIILLVILLIAVIAGFGVYFGISKLNNNSYIYAHGEVDCTFFVDGEELSKFRTPPEIKGNRVLEFNLDLRIDEAGEFKVRFMAEVYKGDELLQNTLINEPNLKAFAKSENGYHHSKTTIAGNQTINLCKGVVIDREYEDSLNINNFKLIVNVYIEKV